MPKPSKEQAWQFIIAYNRHFEAPLHFFRFTANPAYRAEALAKALTTDDPELHALARELKSDQGFFEPLPETHTASSDRGSDAPSAIGFPWQGGLIALVLAMVVAWFVLFPGENSDNGKSIKNAVASIDAEPVKQSRLQVTGSLSGRHVWHSGEEVELLDTVFVEPGAALIIEPGVRVLGHDRSALVVTRGGSIYAKGTPNDPIIFTSSQPAGARSPGDWGGLVLLGNAPINRAVGKIEGIPESDPRGRFGGEDPDSNCGVLEYVRIEYAGFEAFANNELNGLTLGGCGRNTIVRYVQVHRALDDGIEVFGGTVDLSRILVTGANDDSFDWDMGWQGRVQFLIVHQFPEAGDNGFEGDNDKQDHDAQPRSNPTFYNVTMLGAGTARKAQRAMTLRRGTAGRFRNMLISGFSKESIDIRDQVTADLARSGELSLSDSLLFEIGRDGMTYFSTETGDANDDGGLVESELLMAPDQHNRFGTDPMLSQKATASIDPDYQLPWRSPARVNGVVPPEGEFWDQSAIFLGAVRPGGRDKWMLPWSDYSLN